MHGSLYVCASVYRCNVICMEVYIYVRVFIGVTLYAWKFICMCECL